MVGLIISPRAWLDDQDDKAGGTRWMIDPREDVIFWRIRL